MGYSGVDPSRFIGLKAAVVELGMATTLVDPHDDNGNHRSHGRHTATKYDKIILLGVVAHMSHVYNLERSALVG